MPREDVTLFLHVPPEITKQLGRKHHDIHETNDAYMETVWQVYLELASHEHWIDVRCTVDNKILSKQQIADMIYTIVKKHLP